MKVTLTQAIKLNDLIVSFEDAQAELQSWIPLTSTMVFKKKCALEYLEQFIATLEEHELDMEILE